jgi:hypothetical protein
MIPAKYRTERRIWLFAFLLTVVIHVATLVGLWVTRPFAPTPVQASPPDPIQLVFAPEPERQASEEPPQFTELPPDRADEAPERADFLSNVDSRARDRAEGGENEAMPRMEGDSDIPQVRMDPTEGALEPPVPPQDAAEDASEPKDLIRDDLGPLDETAPAPPEVVPEQQSPVVKRRQANPMAALTRPSEGMDLFQPEMQNPGGNSEVYGDISLNTMAWDYAPWLLRFRRDFVQNWYAPYAYYMGMIHGWNTVEIEIAPSGEMIRLDVIGQEGHDALLQSSLAAFQAAAPFRPLPSHFPEETLILKIKLIYPKVPTR